MRLLQTLIATTLLLSQAGCATAPAPRHLIYLHGRIVQEEESARPKHPEYGYYELEQIASAFRARGFVVTAEVRPKGTTVSDAANVVVEQVRALMRSGVPADRITVAGASMGSSIAIRVAARLREPEVRFALIAPCLSRNIPAVAEEEKAYPAGRLLAVRDESDIPTSDCKPWTAEDSRRSGVDAREVVVNTGLRHGFLYRPLPEWLEPVTAFASDRSR